MTEKFGEKRKFSIQNFAPFKSLRFLSDVVCKIFWPSFTCMKMNDSKVIIIIHFRTPTAFPFLSLASKDHEIMSACDYYDPHASSWLLVRHQTIPIMPSKDSAIVLAWAEVTINKNCHLPREAAIRSVCRAVKRLQKKMKKRKSEESKNTKISGITRKAERVRERTGVIIYSFKRQQVCVTKVGHK